jgi:hypothetical protein
MYLELSRPDGDVSRWEKVYKRLLLFNKNFPLKGDNCLKKAKGAIAAPSKKEEEIFEIVRDEAISEKLVFFGGYACALFSEHLKKDQRPILYSAVPSFDLLSEDAKKSAHKLKDKLERTGHFGRVIVEEREDFGEHVSEHYEIVVDGRTVTFVYEPAPGACHNYNVVRIKGKDVNIATTDTILSYYLLFLYINRPYYDRDRLLCMSQYIYDLQYDNLAKNDGVFKRFSKPCIGKQVTLKDIKDVKSHMFNKLKDKRGTREYEEWFLNYNPIEKEKMKALKGKNAEKFDEKIKDVNKFSPSYSKRKHNKHKDNKHQIRARTSRTKTSRIRTTPRTKTRTHKHKMYRRS